MKIHPLADVQTKNIGEGTEVWQFAIILPGAVIGKNCNINCHTFIENDVVIGDNVTIKSGANLWNAIRIEDDVFIGPNVVFATGGRPEGGRDNTYPLTTIKKGASLGCSTTVLPGITVGNYAMSGIGSILTTDVPDYALVYGNPTQWHAWVDEAGNKLRQSEPGIWISENGSRFRETDNGIEKIK